MEAKISLISSEWVPMGVSLRRPAQRKPNDRGKRSVAEVPSGNGGGLQVFVRDGFYRPEDGSAEYLTHWTATSHGWSQIASFAWNGDTRSWETVDRPGPRPT